jgi:hypothetical protein
MHAGAMTASSAPDASHPAIAAVLLAAGLSRRMGGRNKLLAEIGGEAMVRRAARTLLACELEVVAVTGHAREAVEAALVDLDLETVFNPDYRAGQRASVRAGLAAVAGRCDAVLVAPMARAQEVRAAVEAWGLQVLASNPAEYSGSLTAVVMPEGHDADAFRKAVLDRFDMSLGAGLGKLKGRVFRIGHLGDFNDLTLAGTLSGVEMGLGLAGVPHDQGGVQAAFDVLTVAGGSPAATAPAGR